LNTQEQIEWGLTEQQAKSINRLSGQDGRAVA
jgi:hypothetical protein